jgi:hypothetical protein
VRGKHPLTRGSPNGGTPPGKTRRRPAEYIGGYELTQGSEPSQYLEEEKATAIPSVAASESGTAQTGRCTALPKFEIRNLGELRTDFRNSIFDVAAVCSARGCRARAGVEPESYQSSSQSNDLEKSAIGCDSHVGEG